MRGWILPPLALIMSSCNDGSFLHKNSPDWYFSYGESLLGFFESNAHNMMKFEEAAARLGQLAATGNSAAYATQLRTFSEAAARAFVEATPIAYDGCKEAARLAMLDIYYVKYATAAVPVAAKMTLDRLR